MNDTEPRSSNGGEASETAIDPLPANSAKQGSATEDPQQQPAKAKQATGFWQWLNPFRFARRNGSASLRADLQVELARVEAGPDAVFSAAEKELLTNILELRESRVEDVMIPRADIEAVEDEASLGHVLALFQASGHSRMPVFHDNLDDPRGMVHIKDLMSFFAREAAKNQKKSEQPAEDEGAKRNLRAEDALDFSCVDLTKPLGKTGLVRPLHFVPPSMSSLDLMKRMQVTRVQMALVIDEYGGTDGLVSLEDIVETVVGNIEDEHDKDEEEMIQPASEGVWIVDPRIELEDLHKELGVDFNAGEEAEDVDTLGGLLFTILDRVPVRGELISNRKLPGFEFEVVDADPRRIKRLRMYRRRADQRGRIRRIEAAE
ncbi:hemolysin family protein [Polycladidibacter hongkongensis]|uniref:hemolysin family protein n=1 Tax=Polycladidibacter hongkongensis TaxID=1647556 RepID=UPI00082E2F76|nr:hemolysin family protein [Pseudovibrio hongkongensis]